MLRENQVAVVTGGNSGIGKMIARQLAENGCSVMIVGRDEKRGQEVQQELGEAPGNVLFHRADVTKEDEVEELFRKTADTFGPADILVNNAGAEGIMAPLTDFPEEVFDEVVDTNLKGTFLCIKHGLPHMLEKEEGVIVNTASFVGTTVPFPMGAIYGASKAALLSLTSALAEGYGEQGISVMSICPWMTDTPMLDRLTGGQQEVRDQLEQINPSGTFASPQDIADVALSMISGEGDYANGEAYLVDKGGQTQQVEIPYRMV